MATNKAARSAQPTGSDTEWDAAVADYLATADEKS